MSFGTLGPSLGNYGKIRDFDEADAEGAVREDLRRSMPCLSCSTMPRFGANRILTVEQIKDIVALLMSRDSPVNTAMKRGVMSTRRRGMIGALAASGATLASAALPPRNARLAAVTKDTDFACVYHCDFGEPQRFSAMLQSMLND